VKFEKLLGNVTSNYLGLGGSRGKTISEHPVMKILGEKLNLTSKKKSSRRSHKLGQHHHR